MAWEPVIGLECHLQLATRTKMFCGCPATFGAEPNASVCPVCLGLPGALPRANRAAVEAALRLGIAAGSAIRARSVFARNYFYPDMPKDYQISQYDQPLCEGGALAAVVGGVERRFELTRIHLEEDAGKSFHPERLGDRRVSRVDFNRAGVPLLEIVTEPVFHAPDECGAFLGELRRLARWLGISDADMEKGHLRCDANVSLRASGTTALGTKTELKNLNSIKGVEKGIAAEIVRQSATLDGGTPVEQATLLYDADHDRLDVMRTKEDAHDYRYFPEPDLPALVVDDAWIDDARVRMPELPLARERRLVGEYGLPAYDAGVLVEHRELADYYEACAGPEPKLASNWLMTEVLRVLKERDWTIAQWAARVPAARMSAFLAAVAARELPGPLAKQVFAWMPDEEGGVRELLERHGVEVQGTAEALAPLVAQVLAENETAVRQYLAGRGATFGFLVGQVMKKSGGQAVPQVVQQMLKEALAELEGRVAGVTLRTLVLGGGGREHALAWRLARDRDVEVIVAPGNDRIAQEFRCVPTPDPSAVGLAALAAREGAGLVVVGPETPLAEGVVDRLATLGIPAYGPVAAGARLESSKAFAKEVMRAAQVPTARAESCTRRDEVARALDRFGPPHVIKADGLAAGKGVLVTRERAEALEFADEVLGGGFGAHGAALVEEFLPGQEASVMAVCDGRRCVLLPAARDYKRAFDLDRGPNTGGMGAYAPLPEWDRSAETEVEERVVAPVLAEMTARGTPYRGTLYCGLMRDAGSVRVVEFNCRFGDPETQVLMPLVEGDFTRLLAGAARGELEPGLVAHGSGAAVAVALVDEAYPGSPAGRAVIEGLDQAAQRAGARVFGAGIASDPRGWRVSGGRAAYVMAQAATVEESRARVYGALAHTGGSGWRYRRDIARSAAS